MLTDKIEKSETKKKVWFRSIRGSYLPVSGLGWLTYIPFVIYLMFSAIAAFEVTSSAIFAVLIIIPNWVAAGVVLTYVATMTSR